MNVAQAPFLELADGPFSGSAELGRVGQARTVAVREVVHGLHDRDPAASAAATTTEAAAPAEFRGLELVNCVQVDPLHGLLSDEQHRNEQSKHCDEKCLS